MISLHTPLTRETKRIIRAETIALMKPGGMLIHVSRGALVDAKAFIKALKTGHLAAVGLDVPEGEEGIFFEDLSGGVLHTFLTAEALTEIAGATVADICALAGQEPFVEGSLVA